MSAINLSVEALAALAAFAGAWLAVALWATLRGRAVAARAGAARRDGVGAAALLEAAPAVPLIVLPNGRIEGSPRAAAMLGLEAELRSLSDLGPALSGPVEAARTGTPFVERLNLDDGRVVEARGALAPAPYSERAVLLWLTDITRAAAETADLKVRLDRHAEALQALSGLIEAAPFPMWHRGPDLNLAMVNRAYVAAVEAKDAAAAVREGIELIEEGPLRAAEQVRESGETSSRIVPATISGERRTLRVVEVPLGKAGVAGFAIDVEEQEQAKAELGRFVRAQRDMLDRLSAGVAQFGRDRSLIFFNQPFARLFSLSADFLADTPEFDRVIDAMRESGHLPEVRDFPEWKAERRAWFTSGLAADEEDWLLPGGKHMRVVAQPLPDGGLLVVFEDRTEQIQLASARDTLLRVRTATFDNLFEAVGVFASDGRLHLWNNRFRKLWNFEEERLAAHPRIDALVPDIARLMKRPSHANLVRELVRSATVERKQRSGRVSLLDGREFEFASVPLPDGNALFTMLDVTDSRKVEEALRDRNEALEEADRLKTAFVSNMSYELRTPLTSIGGFAEMLAGGYAGELGPVAAEYVAAILDSVARLSVLIDNVLDLTQSDTGSLLLAEEEVELATICGEVTENARAAAVRKGIDLAVELDASAGVVTGDHRRLGQAIGNLIANALLYTDKGGRVLVRAEGDAREGRIIVSDNGRGIAPADQARVFDRFHRTVERQPDDESAGLGLPLARQFIEAHGGSIELQSELGQGTTLIVRLPRTEEQSAGYRGAAAAGG